MKNDSYSRNWLRLAALCMVLAAVLGIFAGCSKNADSKTTSDPSSLTTEATPETTSAPSEEPGSAPETEDETVPEPETDPSVDYEGLQTLPAYTLEELPADDARLETVIAECGDRSLTNRELQMFYFMQLFGY